MKYWFARTLRRIANKLDPPAQTATDDIRPYIFRDEQLAGSPLGMAVRTSKFVPVNKALVINGKGVLSMTLEFKEDET